MYLGIDIGGTGIKAGVIDKQGLMAEKITQATRANSGNAELQKQTREIASYFLEKYEIAGIGLGSPGPLDAESGIVLKSANMPAIGHCNLLEPLKSLVHESELHIPVRLDNDANCAALGEMVFGHGKELNNFAVFTLGTGVGGGLILERKLFRGFKGNGFEIGHIPVIVSLLNEALGIKNIDLPTCGCGNKGCLETFASATAIVHWYHCLATGQKEKLGASQVAALAENGNAEALLTFEIASRALASALVTVTHLMNTSSYIFTGGMAKASGLLKKRIIHHTRDRLFTIFRDSLNIVFATDDEDAGIKGAAALVLE